jgi:hypothetical protein
MTALMSDLAAVISYDRAMLHRTLTEGAPLAITPPHVRQQIAVIEAAQRQNPHVYPIMEV